MKVKNKNIKNIKSEILHRLKISRGHLNKIIKMVEEDKYCIDIVHQSLAVQAALKKADGLVLKNQLQTCVAESIREGNDKEAIDEIMGVLEKK